MWRSIACAVAILVSISACGSGITEADVDAAVESAVEEAEQGFEEELEELSAALEEARATAADSDEALSMLEEELAALAEERDALLAERDELLAASEQETTGTDATDPADEPTEVPPSEYTVMSEGLTLPTSPDGAVAVVARQPLGDDRIAVTVQNNTGAPVSRIQVSATVRDESGALVGSDSVDDLHPVVLEPGEVAVGELYFGGDLGDTPSDGAVEFSVDYQGDAGGIGDLAPLPIVEFTHSGQTFAGLIHNSTDSERTLVRIAVGCFSASGEMTGYADTFADRDDIPVGETSPFSLRQRVDDCAHFILAASGWEL